MVAEMASRNQRTATTRAMAKGKREQKSERWEVAIGSRGSVDWGHP